MKTKKVSIFTASLLFILLMGLVSLFSDMTHEGANSVLGDFLSLAGADATTIGFVSGLGMFLGYGLRLISGYIADKTHKYWLITIIGYGLDLIFIPLLFFVPAGGWFLACLFVTGEKIGKAVKKPAKDSLISFASADMGSGKGFAIGEIVDQLGAFLGPVLVFLMSLLINNDDTFYVYKICFLCLGIPAIICMILLLIAKSKYPHPESFEKESDDKTKNKVISKPFVFFLIAISLFAFGFIDFSLIIMHISNINIIDSKYLPLMYAVAMLVDAISAYIFGVFYDKKGYLSIILATIICSTFSLFIFFFNSLWSTIIGLVLWGIGMGAVESVLKAFITDLSNKSNRSFAFGLFDATFGLLWFLGSWLLGFLYDKSIIAFIAVSISTITLSIIFYVLSSHFKKIPVKKDKTKIT